MRSGTARVRTSRTSLGNRPRVSSGRTVEDESRLWVISASRREKRWGIIALQMVGAAGIEIAIEHGPVFHRRLRRACGVQARRRAQQSGPAELHVLMSAKLVGQREDVGGIGAVEKVAVQQLD